MAQNTGATSPGTISYTNVDGLVDWVDPNNVNVSDNLYATADLTVSTSSLLDSYVRSGNYGYWSVGDTTTSVGQTFSCTSNSDLDSCKFKLLKVGSPTGNCYAKLYAHTGVFGSTGKPTGTALATSDAIDVSTISGVAQLVTFTFSGSNKYFLRNLSTYCIVFEYTNGSSTNSIYIELDTSSPSHSGNSVLYNITWVASSLHDVEFYVYSKTYKISNGIIADNFGFSIPTGAAIRGIKVEVEAKSSGTDLVKEYPYSCSLRKNNVAQGTCKSTTASLATSDTYVVYGSATDVWNNTWTAADINNSGFGFFYQVWGTGICSVDRIRITVYYDNVINPTNSYSSNDTYAQLTGAISGSLDVSISKDAGVTYSSVLSKTFTDVESIETYGAGSTELWGYALTGDDVDDTHFRLKISHNGVSQIYKTFGFAIASSTILTGLEVAIEGKYEAVNTSIYVDHIKIKAYYGTSVLQIQAGSMAFATDGRKAGEGAGNGTGVLTYYDGTNWIASDTGATVAA